MAHIEFFGKPASDEQIDFIVQGTVVEKNAPYKPVLRNVSKLVSITPEETNIAVTTDPSGNTLTFPNNGDLREITVYFPDGVTPKPAEFPGTTGFATNYYNANLYEANGMPIFANGKSDAYIAGYKLTVTRTRVQGGKKIIYSFTGDPDATTSGYFELYPGGVFANGDWYLLDPIAISVNNGTPPTPTTVNLAPSSLTRTAGTSFTSDPIYITGGVTIAGLGLTDNATPANSVSPFAGVTATVNSPNSSFTVKGNTSIVDTKTVYVFYYQNGKLLSQPFSVTINPAPGAPSLSISTSDKHISANVGEAMTPRIITVTPSSGTNLQVRVSQTFYRGVSFDVQSSGNTIRVYGTPTLTSGGAQQISVAGTVLINDTRVDATATSFDITITDNTPAPPDMTLNPSSISDLVAGTPVSGRSVTIVQSPSSPLLSITGFSTASDGTAGTAGAHVRIWNGLTLTASGGKITITGTPEKAGDAKFTLAGTIGTDNVTATLTLSVKSAPASANLFSNWTAWTLNPNIAARTATLDIPVTSEFVAAFGTGGKVTTADIKAVGLDVDSPYAALKEPVKFAIVSGGTYGTLRLTLEFDQPASGHANDWYEDIEIDLIEVTGANNATKWSSYASNPIALDDLKQTGGSTGSGGGCDAGFAGAALLLAGAFFAVSKARKR
ncbi:MAG: hypothetical protein LBS45_09715 [Synergistaceae bacterium]|nr:hypothetical protein [Synergistaceae bacterium]